MFAWPDIPNTKETIYLSFSFDVQFNPAYDTFGCWGVRVGPLSEDSIVLYCSSGCTHGYNMTHLSNDRNVLPELLRIRDIRCLTDTL